jgi:hypothetical protein
MVEEYTSIMRNDVWDIVSRPEGNSVVSFRWLYKINHIADGINKKFKEIFLVRRFSQREGVDYKETFSPIAKHDFIQAVIYVASVMRWRIHQKDVKTTCLEVLRYMGGTLMCVGLRNICTYSNRNLGHGIP